MIDTVITPIEVDGQFYGLPSSLDGHETQQRGPFANADEAEAMADRWLGSVAECFIAGAIRQWRR